MLSRVWEVVEHVCRGVDVSSWLSNAMIESFVLVPLKIAIEVTT